MYENSESNLSFCYFFASCTGAWFCKHLRKRGELNSVRDYPILGVVEGATTTGKGSHQHTFMQHDSFS